MAGAAGRVIVALDLPEGEALALADMLPRGAWLKVGMTLFYAAGPRIVTELKARGFHVFLDLKLHDIPHQVRELARASYAAGADGVICSPLEAGDLRGVLGPEALIVTPGVRPAGADVGDQSRVATPGAAVKDGASHVVVGRPITQAADPAAAFEAIAADIRGNNAH